MSKFLHLPTSLGNWCASKFHLEAARLNCSVEGGREGALQGKESRSVVIVSKNRTNIFLLMCYSQTLNSSLLRNWKYNKTTYRPRLSSAAQRTRKAPVWKHSTKGGYVLFFLVALAGINKRCQLEVTRNALQRILLLPLHY